MNQATRVSIWATHLLNCDYFIFFSQQYEDWIMDYVSDIINESYISFPIDIGNIWVNEPLIAEWTQTPLCQIATNSNW